VLPCSVQCEGNNECRGALLLRDHIVANPLPLHRHAAMEPKKTREMTTSVAHPNATLLCRSGTFGHAIYYCQRTGRLANEVFLRCGFGPNLAAASQYQLILCSHRPANGAPQRHFRRISFDIDAETPQTRVRNLGEITSHDPEQETVVAHSLIRARIWEHGSFCGSVLVFRSNVTPCRCIVGVSFVGL
jgi:hypothetical protein